MKYQMALQEAIKYVHHVDSFYVNGESCFLEFGFAKRENGSIGCFFHNGLCVDFAPNSPAIFTLKDYSEEIKRLQTLQQFNEDLRLLLADRQVAIEPQDHNESS